MLRPLLFFALKFIAVNALFIWVIGYKCLNFAILKEHPCKTDH